MSTIGTGGTSEDAIFRLCRDINKSEIGKILGRDGEALTLTQPARGPRRCASLAEPSCAVGPIAYLESG